MEMKMNPQLELKEKKILIWNYFSSISKRKINKEESAIRSRYTIFIPRPLRQSFSGSAHSPHQANRLNSGRTYI